jgi:hypothetical protein
MTLLILLLAALLVLTIFIWRNTAMSTTQVTTLVNLAQQTNDLVLTLQAKVSSVGASLTAEIGRVTAAINTLQGQNNPALDSVIAQLQGVNSNLQASSDLLTADQAALDAELPDPAPVQAQ